MKKKLIVLLIGFIVLTIFGIISTIYISNLPIGDLADKNIYGGDAYTGIQQASATGASNTLYLSQIAMAGFSLFGIFNIIVGIIGIIYVTISLKELKNKK